MQAPNSRLIIAALGLRDAVKKSKDYDSEIESLRISSKSDDYIEKQISIITKNSKQGIPTLASLQQEFSAISAKMLQQSLLKKQNKSTLDKIALKLSGIVHIRKVDADENSKENEDILARANKAVESGNIQSAIDEVSKLPQSDVETLNNWIRKSKDYISSIAASEEILKYAIRISS